MLLVFFNDWKIFLHAISILIYTLPTESSSVSIVQEYKKKRNKQTNSVSAQQKNVFNRKAKM